MDYLEKILKESGLKVTKARLAILKILSKNTKPIPAEEIFKKLGKKIGLDQATVYRTLTTLHEEGIIKRVDLRKDKAHFELAENHHHHIVCTKCDEMEDFENKEIEKALQKIAKKSSKFKRIKEHSLELFGLCAKCE